MSSSTGPSELLLKILVIGEGGTGKTCLIRRYVHGIFQATNKATIGVDFALKVLHYNGTAAQGGQKVITLQLWDIAGQERYGQMTRVYYQAGVGAIVVCDVTRPETMELAVKWKQDVDAKVFLGSTGKPIPCVLLVNKCDLGQLDKTKEEMDAFCQEHGFEAWFETSAKENKNVDNAFGALVECVLQATGSLGGGANGAGGAGGAGADGEGGSGTGVLRNKNRAKPEEKKKCAC